MISEEMLSRAAKESRAIFADNLERDYISTSQHEFSTGFEKKIKKLYRRANHPYLYTALNRAASVILAVCIAGGVWLSVDVEARAAFVQWVREVYEDSVLYRYFNEQERGTLPEYEITALPDGYTLTDSIVDETSSIQIFEDDTSALVFMYRFVSGDTQTELFAEDYEYESLTVGQHSADFYSPTDKFSTNELIWNDTDSGIEFQISSFCSRDEMLAMANSAALKN